MTLVLTEILDDVSARFVINSTEFLALNPQEYFFIMEEAHWFAMDFYGFKNVSLRYFAELVLIYNGLASHSCLTKNLAYKEFESYKSRLLDKIYKLFDKKSVAELSDKELSSIFNYTTTKAERKHTPARLGDDKDKSEERSELFENDEVKKSNWYFGSDFYNNAVGSDFSTFVKYKQSIKVFGTVILNPEMTHFLLVRQIASKNFTFPKGKRSKDETGKACAIRETIEEVGFDVTDYITDISVTIFNKITFYVALNVNKNTIFHTQTRNEIGEIFWAKIDNIRKYKNCEEYKIVYTAFIHLESVINTIKSTQFRFRNLDQLINDLDKKSILKVNNISENRPGSKRNFSLVVGIGRHREMAEKWSSIKP